MFLPLAVLLVALPPRHPVALGFAGLVLVLSFTGPPPDALWYVERGWALIVGAWFLVAVLALPGSGFLTRAMVAVAASLGSASVVLAVRGGAFARVDELISNRLRASGRDILEVGRTWPGSEALRDQYVRAIERFVEIQTQIFPALLALGSIAGLAVAWWAFRRLTARGSEPFGPLREFRFHDGLVWLLISGLALLLLPLDGLASRAGSNLLAFMAALYALRGVAVLVALTGAMGGVPGPLAMILGGLLAVLLYPVVVATTFVVGLTDTWLDIRKRRETPPPPRS
jgi:hypothetical protein